MILSCARLDSNHAWPRNCAARARTAASGDERLNRFSASWMTPWTRPAPPPPPTPPPPTQSFRERGERGDARGVAGFEARRRARRAIRAEALEALEEVLDEAE